jgi:hypothetical protein
MPFDSAPELPAEVRLIDEALRILGLEGQYWIKLKWHDGNKHCLEGALQIATRKLHAYASERNTVRLIVRSIMFLCGQRHGTDRRPIIDFNDHLRTTFDEVRMALLVARNDAVEAHANKR